MFGYLARSPCREADVVLRRAELSLSSVVWGWYWRVLQGAAYVHVAWGLPRVWAAAAHREQDQTCFVVCVSEDVTEWGLNIKEIMLRMSSRMRIVLGLIWLPCFMENLLCLQAFEAGGLKCFFLAAKDMSASIETMTKAQESFWRDYLCMYLHQKQNHFIKHPGNAKVRRKVVFLMR